jgi:hypothetical protein
MTWEHYLTCREGNTEHWSVYSRGTQQPQRSEGVHEAWPQAVHRDRDLPDAKLASQFLPLSVTTLVLEQAAMFVSLRLYQLFVKAFNCSSGGEFYKMLATAIHSMPPSLWCAQPLLSLGDMFLCCSLVCVATFAMRHKMAVKVFWWSGFTYPITSCMASLTITRIIPSALAHIKLVEDVNVTILLTV